MSQVVIYAQCKHTAYQQLASQLTHCDYGEFRLRADGLAGPEDLALF